MDNYTRYHSLLNKHDVVPLYAQLEKMLRGDILSGIFGAGDLIPSETVLSRDLGITRTTVRKAIETLAKDGLVQQIRGKGTVVSFKKLSHNVWNFSGVTDYLRRQNMLPTSRILDKTIQPFNGKEYMKLVRARGVKVGVNIQYLTIDTSCVPMDLFPGIDQYNFEIESLYSTIREKYGVFPGTASIQITPLLADQQAAEIFSIAPDTPLIQASGSAFSVDGIEIEKVNVIYGPAMDFNLTVEIGS
jgi:DNA-binding GntR family transcriptional regulator